MVEVATFKLRMTGGLTDHHQVEAYDGYDSLAGAALALSLITNWVETGKIRHRGDFLGRHAVRALPMQQGSLVAEFVVYLQSQPTAIFGIGAGTASALLYGIVQRVVARNIGLTPDPLNTETKSVLLDKAGDVEALVAATEPSLRRAHEVIGNGADHVEWTGGFSTMAVLSSESKTYMKASINDPAILEADVSVSGFYGNSGHGQVYDPNLGRNVPIGMAQDTLTNYGTFFSWGLHQYTNNTGKKIRIKFTRVLAVNGRPKKYIIKSAQESQNS